MKSLGISSPSHPHLDRPDGFRFALPILRQIDRPDGFRSALPILRQIVEIFQFICSVIGAIYALQFNDGLDILFKPLARSAAAE
jgi:hypothetical protein